MMYRQLLLIALVLISSVTPSVAGEMIQVRTPYSTYANAYVAGPENAAAAVLVIPDIWGIGKPVEQWVDRLGAIGLRAMVIDLYDGRMVTSPAMAGEVYGTIDPVWIEQNLKGALAYLDKHFGNIVLMGWGEGARQAVRLVKSDAAGVKKVSAVAIYNDDRASAGDLIRNISLPVLDVSTPHSLVDPFRPAKAGDLESTWKATEGFLSKRLN